MNEVNKNLSDQILNAMLETIKDLHLSGGANNQQLVEISELCSDLESNRSIDSVGSDGVVD